MATVYENLKDTRRIVEALMKYKYEGYYSRYYALANASKDVGLPMQTVALFESAVHRFLTEREPRSKREHVAILLAHRSLRNFRSL